MTTSAGISIRTRLMASGAVLLLAVAGCGGDDDTADTEVPADTGSTEASADSEAPTETAADESSGGEADGGESSDGGATASVGDNSWEFTDIVECEIGGEVSADFRQFIATTADGSARLDVAYFADDTLTGLDGVTIDADVDGEDWTYASSYAGTEGVFAIAVRADGADGTADARAVGIGAPGDDLTIDFSFTC